MERTSDCNDRCYGEWCVHLECSHPAPVDLSIVDYLRSNSDADFEFVALGGMRRAGDPPRYFLADYRDSGGYRNPWVCVHEWTASPASLLRNLARVDERAAYFEQTRKFWVFEARNKSQCRAWLQDQGYSTDSSKPAPLPTINSYVQERIIVNSRDRQIAASQARIAMEQQRIDRLSSLPEEPTTDDPDGALAVWFLHRFRDNSQFYTYAAVKAGDGKWYTTGPASPKGYSWEQLVEWHFTEANADCPMYVATEWDVIV